MSLGTLRILVDAVMVLVAADFLMDVAGAVTWTAGGVIVSLGYFLFYRAARKLLLKESGKAPTFMFYLYWYAPTVLFVALPMAWSFRRASEGSFFDWFLTSLPWISLIFPLVLLAVVHHGLSARIREEG